MNSPPAEQQDPRHYLRILWRWKLLLLAFLVLTPAAAALLASEQPKVYRSSVLLEVQPQAIDSSLFSQAPVAPLQSILAVARVATTNRVAAAAAEQIPPPRPTPRALLGKISVRPDTDAGFITISAEDPDRRRAAVIANAYGAAVVADRRRMALDQVNRAIDGVEQRLAALSRADRVGRLQLSEQLQRLRALGAAQGGNAQIIERAVPSQKPVTASSIRRAVVIGVVIGLLLGVGAVALAQASDRRIRTRHDLEELFGGPILSAVPSTAFGDAALASEQNDESFQGLRNALTYFNVDRQLSSVVVASPGPEDGKTTVATGLALASARAGKRVILVDADLRRPAVGERLGIEPAAGLSDVLATDRPLADTLVDYPLDGLGDARLQVLPAGPLPPNPSQLLSSQRMRMLLSELEGRADLVVIDTAAALVVSDALPLLQAASGVALVARVNRSTKDEVRRLREIIASAGGTMLGAVETGSEADGSYRYLARVTRETVADPPTRQMPALPRIPSIARPRLGLSSRRRLLGVAGLVPALTVVAVLVTWATLDGGFSPTVWYPGGVLLLLVLVVTAWAGRWRLGALPRTLQIALAALAGYTAWSYLSIIWADAKGIAWEGANRTLVYLVIFLLVSGIAVRVKHAAVMLAAWTLGITGLAIFVLLTLPDVPGGPAVLGGGLANPVGYSNAQAALWLMATWPALAFAACREVQPWLRGVFAAAAVVLADIALLSYSRGSLVAGGIVAVVFLVAVSGRTRSLLTLMLVAGAVAATAPHLLDVADDLARPGASLDALGSVDLAIIVAAIAAGIVVAVAGMLEARRPQSPRFYRVGKRVVAGVGLCVALAVATTALVATDDPLERVDREWQEFKGGAEPSRDPGRERASTTAGPRYDYYRVALDVFGENPILGIGADNFAQDYLARGRSLEFPRYPHSIELRALLQTGLIGTFLLVAALGAALLTAWHAMRAGGVLRETVAGGATLVFVYWLVQGSADWFWEFPALGGSAFAMLGLAAALAPRPAPHRATGLAARLGLALGRALGWTLAGAATMAACASLIVPWMAEIQMSRAEEAWAAAPDASFRQLDLAARLNRLSERPDLIAGSIALRLGRLGQAEQRFERALQRDGRNAYATLELAAIASHGRRPDVALRLAQRAVTLSPQDFLARSVLADIRAGRAVGIDRLNRQMAALARDAER